MSLYIYIYIKQLYIHLYNTILYKSFLIINVHVRVGGCDGWVSLYRTPLTTDGPGPITGDNSVPVPMAPKSAALLI